MTFLAPQWLTLLAPWTALAIWLLLSRHRAATVPFVELWRGSAEHPRESHQFAPPPLPIVAILAAIFLAIVAAAAPIILRAHAPSGIQIILDRGITMSSHSSRADQLSRRDEVVNAARTSTESAKLNATFATVPASPASSWSDLTNAHATCVDTTAELNRTVADALARSTDPVIVLTDQPLQDNPRVIVISPTKKVANVAITRFGLREHPTTQAMVTIRNDSALTKCNLKIESKTESIELPQPGQERSYFVDLPSIGKTARASIDAADDFDGDNAAYLVRQRTAPKIEMRGTLAPEVQRVVSAYETALPASDDSATVTIVTSEDQIKNNEPAIITPLAVSQTNGAAVTTAHPVTNNLNPKEWTELRSAPPPTGQDWTPIIIANNQPLVSIREHPSRQVWIGVSSRALARSPDFVILWTNALDWVASASPETFNARTVGSLSPRPKPDSGRDLWPGFYHDNAGKRIAANAPPASFRAASSPVTEEARRKLAALTGSRRGGTDLAPSLVVVAIGCILLAACLWPSGRTRRILTAFSAARTV